ncbi:entericidin A/B family lipoprotein [Frigidibacter sp. SD6-1]|nr:entericidin A/B family lipoprotein [Frigidibacter sp. SD6-1]
MTDKLFLALAAIMVFGLSACETFEGAGRDIENAGEAVTDAAQDAQY